MNTGKCFTFIKINITDVRAKFALNLQPLIGVDTLARAPNTTTTTTT
jgi:hypothetical protein